MRSVTATGQKARAWTLRDEALLILDNRGAVLDIAREVSRLMRAAGIRGAVIGGVAVVLHGHVRTTRDVDIFIPPPLEPLADLLTASGFTFDRAGRAFVRQGLPVHLVNLEIRNSRKTYFPDFLSSRFTEVGPPPKEIVEIEGVTTVSLADLIGMKLRSGSADPLRAQDLADVIGLIRHHRLTGGFARHLDRDLRPAYRKLARLIQREGSGA